jgi:hypothetical protein
MIYDSFLNNFIGSILYITHHHYFVAIHRLCDQLQDNRRYTRCPVRPNVEPEVGMQRRHAIICEKLQGHRQAAH